MSILVVEGDPGAIENLHMELLHRRYLNDEFLLEIVEAPDLSIGDNWDDFLYQLQYLIQHYIAGEDSE